MSAERLRSARARARVLAWFAALSVAALALVAPAQAAEQTLRKFAEGLVSPVVLTPLGSDRLIVVDQVGIAYTYTRKGERSPAPFLDLRPRMTELRNGFDERGFLGLALHPKFGENRKLYVYYSAPRRSGRQAPWDHTSRLSEFTVAEDLSRAEMSSERVLLEFDQPYFNHNGGRLAFGPDGFLYAGIGDGGNANDQGHDRGPAGNGQDLTTLLGKILRIDVDHPDEGKPYGIPADNPLVNTSAARPEIFAWGIRNPWGIAFDSAGELPPVFADVGQGRFEEINVLRRGGNYGWNLREGRHPFDPANPLKPDASRDMAPSDLAGLVDPVLEYKNLNAFATDPDGAGLSVTGGQYYRGRSLPHLAGKYIFGDWSRQWAAPDGRLFVATPSADPNGAWTMEPLPVASHPDLKLGGYLLAFGNDQDGEIYVMTSARAGLVDRTGVVWKLAPVGVASAR